MTTPNEDELPRSFLYAAVWRWHFYAGIFAAPFLLILAITGAIYLFNDEINDAVYPELRFSHSAGAPQTPARWAESARSAFPGSTVKRIDLPAEPGRSALLFLKTPQEPERRVYVDPVTARVLGSQLYTSTLVGFADRMHGSLLLGKFGDGIVELAACWGLVLIVTGVYLWWPRGRERVHGVVVPRLGARGRRFWRDLHKVTGLYTAALALFLIVSGLPWANLWGGQILQPITAALELGYPGGSRTKGNVASKTVVQTLGEAPWTVEQAPMPLSTPPAVPKPRVEHDRHGPHAHSVVPTDPSATGIGVNEAVQHFAKHGLVSGYRLFLPLTADGAYTAYTYPNPPEGQRTVHLDRYSGEVLSDVGFADYGPIAKAVEWGVAIHLGNYFGLANQLLMLLACLMIILLVLSGLVMWWKRRPAGTLGAPPKPRSYRATTGVVAITLSLAVLLPMVGASLIAVLAIENIVTRVRRTIPPTQPA